MATTSISDKLAKLEKKIAKREKTIADETKELDKDRIGDTMKLNLRFLTHETKGEHITVSTSGTKFN